MRNCREKKELNLKRLWWNEESSLNLWVLIDISLRAENDF